MPYTPGPWKWSESIGAVVVDRPDMQYVVAPLWRAEMPAGMESEALDNARLIAAAPDLLEALEAIVMASAMFPALARECGTLINDARAAIAKAKGQ